MEGDTHAAEAEVEAEAERARRIAESIDPRNHASGFMLFDHLGWHLPPTNDNHRRCGKYLSIMTSCVMPIQQGRHYYEHGEMGLCRKEWENFMGCVRLRLAVKETRTRIYRQNMEELVEWQRLPEEHFWVERKEPPPDWPSFAADEQGEELWDL